MKKIARPLQPTSPPTRTTNGKEAEEAGLLERFDLSWHLPHLLRRAHFEAEAQFARVYGETATSRQMALVVAVMQNPGGSQANIARLVGLDDNTCSDLVKRTLAKGWLEKKKSATDARTWALAATPAGRRMVNDHSLPLAQQYVSRVAGILTPRQQRQLAILLRKMLEFH